MAGLSPRCSVIDKNGKVCGKKLNQLDIICQCGQKFCMQHRLPEDHHCSFDHKTYERQRLLDKINKNYSSNFIESMR